MTRRGPGPREEDLYQLESGVLLMAQLEAPLFTGQFHRLMLLGQRLVPTRASGDQPRRSRLAAHVTYCKGTVVLVDPHFKASRDSCSQLLTQSGQGSGLSKPMYRVPEQAFDPYAEYVQSTFMFTLGKRQMKAQKPGTVITVLMLCASSLQATITCLPFEMQLKARAHLHLGRYFKYLCRYEDTCPT